MEEGIRAAFGLSRGDIRSCPSLTLAYVGDSAYELVIRTVLVEARGTRPGLLNRAAQQYVKAESQAAIGMMLLGELSEEEAAVYRRGRNAHPSTIAKHASMSAYRKATGFEALIGYLYLSGRHERMYELIRKGMAYIDEKTDAEKTDAEKTDAEKTDAEKRE